MRGRAAWTFAIRNGAPVLVALGLGGCCCPCCGGSSYDTDAWSTTGTPAPAAREAPGAPLPATASAAGEIVRSAILADDYGRIAALAPGGFATGGETAAFVPAGGALPAEIDAILDTIREEIAQGNEGSWNVIEASGSVQYTGLSGYWGVTFSFTDTGTGFALASISPWAEEP